MSYCKFDYKINSKFPNCAGVAVCRGNNGTFDIYIEALTYFGGDDGAELEIYIMDSHSVIVYDCLKKKTTTCLDQDGRRCFTLRYMLSKEDCKNIPSANLMIKVKCVQNKITWLKKEEDEYELIKKTNCRLM